MAICHVGQRSMTSENFQEILVPCLCLISHIKCVFSMTTLIHFMYSNSHTPIAILQYSNSFRRALFHDAQTLSHSLWKNTLSGVMYLTPDHFYFSSNDSATLWLALLNEHSLTLWVWILLFSNSFTQQEPKISHVSNWRSSCWNVLYTGHMDSH